MKVSYFNNVKDIKPKEYDLERWLKDTINPPKHLEQEVIQYRETLDKKLKEKLPCITISASFKNHRNEQNVDTKNKLICIDIDRYTKKKKGKCNLCVDMLLVKEMFISHPSTLYTGFSVGGDGVYAIICIEDENDLEGYFNHFQEKFARIGINIDEVCKDYTRLRFFSVDKEAYYNPNALHYKRIIEPSEPKKQDSEPEINDQPVTQKQKPKDTHERRFEILNNWDKAKKIIDIIESRSIDITSGYNDWIKIGGAFYNEFNEDGANLFHRVSKFHPDYTYKACEDKFNSCKKMSKATFASFMYIADSYGVRFTDRK